MGPFTCIVPAVVVVAIVVVLLTKVKVKYNIVQPTSLYDFDKCDMCV